MKLLIYFFLLLSWTPLLTQSLESPCSHAAIMARHLLDNPKAERDLEETEKELQKIIAEQKANPTKAPTAYTIPVVMHIFHDNEDGKMNMEQALSGLELLNDDFNGLNDGWDEIDSAFDSIKGSMPINFCLAKIDPDGNPTTGVIYHQDPEGLRNEGNLFRVAWDNYKYFNIYLPKYAYGDPTNFTAYAYLPSQTRTDNNTDGIFYSSIRWGYGDHSELEEGDDWASVGTHEVGHWLNLAHTFRDGCIGLGDLVDDTPPTLGGEIELSGCENNNFSCGVATNGSNFMDYNHRCKRMFTQGQIERMTAALSLSSRINLWSDSNLQETGCSGSFPSATIDTKEDFNLKLYPNPSSDQLIIHAESLNAKLSISNTKGQNIVHYQLTKGKNILDLSTYSAGLYIAILHTADKQQFGKFTIVR